MRYGASDLTGRRFTRLLVIGHVYEMSETRWICKCDCGKECVRRGRRLISGESYSCGCLANIRRATSRTTHGATVGNAIKEYATWVSIKGRCCNPNDKGYANYGGRGIRICDRWKDSFENFLSDIGTRPSPSHSIDRKDNNGNYCPENCRWATRKEQMRNTRFNTIITFDGQTKCIAEWAEMLGISTNAILKRISSWGVERAMTTPVNESKRRKQCAV